MALQGKPHSNAGAQNGPRDKKQTLRQAALGMFSPAEIEEFRRELAKCSRRRKRLNS